MIDTWVFITIVNLFILLIGVSVGRAVIQLHIRKEENKKRELELELLEQRNQIIERGKAIATSLEDLIYQTHVQQEIDKIIRRKTNG